MKTAFRRKTAFVFAIGCICAIIMAGLWIRHWYWQATELSAVPPAQSFTRIFHMPVPAGVSELKIAGTAHLSGIVWMRFKVADADGFLSALRRHGYVLVAMEEFSINARGAGDSPYAVMVGWEKSRSVAKPRFYRFHREPMGVGWAGEMLIDPAQKIIYLHGFLL